MSKRTRKTIDVQEILKRDTQFLKEMVVEQIHKERPDCHVTMTERGLSCDPENREFVVGVEAKTRALIDEVVCLGQLFGYAISYTKDYDPRAIFDEIIDKALPFFEEEAA